MAFACQEGGFNKIVTGVALDCASTMISLTLEGLDEPLELNCPIHSDIIDHIKDDQRCVMGYYLGGKRLGAFFVPLQLTNFYEGAR